MAGRTVEVPDNVERVVAVGSGALRQVAYLESMDKVVGVEQIEKDKHETPYNIANKEKILELPVIGPNHGGDPELIAGAEPDVVFYRGKVEDAKNLQSKTGIPVVWIDVGGAYKEDRETLYECWETCGKVLDKEDRAKELKEYTEKLVSDLKSRTQGIPDDDKPSVYPGAISHRGGHGMLSTKYPYPPFRFLNANNAVEGVDYESVTSIMISQEKLLAWDPSVIFIDLSNLNLAVKDVEKNPVYKDIEALEKDNVYAILPYSWYHRNYGTILADSYYMGHVLYPDKFSDINPEEKADKIYSKFVGEPVYEEMEDKFGGYRELDF